MWIDFKIELSSISKSTFLLYEKVENVTFEQFVLRK